ncbi:MAG: hypothetical protein ACTSPB_00595 [Candidatus Thorarchaeota archaeon]
MKKDNVGLKKTVILQESKRRFKICIPKAFVTELGWKKGDKIGQYIDGRSVVLGDVPDDIDGMETKVNYNKVVHTILITNEHCRKLKWKKEDTIKVVLVEGGLVLKKAAL